MTHGYPDFEGDKSGLYLKPEWAAKEGINKTFRVVQAACLYGVGPTGAYVVTAGKTLYICGLAFSVNANLAADAELNQIGRAYIMDNTTGVVLADLGGNGGGQVVFAVPFKVPSGHQFLYVVVCEANHACDLRMVAWGYEI